jgi:cAMP-specific phosphodiesterase 4
VSVLENYHVAETYKVLLKKDNNIFENLRPEEYRVVRRRMIEGILSTDMATHSKNLLSMRSKLESFNIKGGQNVDKLLVADNASKNFENQQLILNQCIHTSDLSNPAKIPQVYEKWSELIFQEFFNQGDLEKQNGMPISMLCDRTTVKINKSQMGFINFVVIPQFEMMLNIMPEIQPYLDAVQFNFKACELRAKEEETK